jgi:hypothetical protein
MKTGSRRYWYLDDTGQPVDVVLQAGQPVPEGYTPGFSPRTLEAQEAHRARMRELHTGRSASETTRQRMSMAKAGKPKTPEHIEAMRASHLQRGADIRAIQQQFGVDYWAALDIYRTSK